MHIVVVVMFSLLLWFRFKLAKLSWDNKFFSVYYFGKKNKKGRSSEFDKLRKSQLLRQQKFAFRLYLTSIVLGLVVFVGLAGLVIYKHYSTPEVVISIIGGIGKFAVAYEARDFYKKATKSLLNL